MKNDSIADAWAEVQRLLPHGWAVSISTVPSLGEWGGTVSPTAPPFSPLLQTDTHLSELDALRGVAARLREFIAANPTSG